MPAPFRKAFIRTSDGGDYQIEDTLRARTHFFHSNLLHVNNAPFSDFNIIFCQNVLIYFERTTQLWIIDQLCERLRVGGLLVLGAGEDFRSVRGDDEWGDPLRVLRAGDAGDAKSLRQGRLAGR